MYQYVCLSQLLTTAAVCAGLLLWVKQADDMDRLLHRASAAGSDVVEAFFARQGPRRNCRG